MICIGLDIRDSKNPSGVGRYIRELLSGLQSDHNIRLHVFHDEPKDRLPYSLSSNVMYYYSTCRHAILWEQIWLPNVLNKLNLDLYHATNNIGFPWYYKGRKVLTIHDLIPFIYPEVLTSKLYWFRFVNTLKNDARNADIIIADSISTKNDIIKSLKVPEKKIKVIWPTDFNSIKFNTDKIKLSKTEKEKIGIKGKYIIHNGGIDPRKNLPKLLNSYKRFINEIQPCQCQLIITGRDKNEYSKKVIEYSKTLGLDGKVIFTGAIPATLVRSLLENAEFAIYPSLYEGFGLPVIEAMAAGVPVITSNVSSLPEISGGAALLIDPNSEEEILNAMRHIFKRNDICKLMVKSGYSWITENTKRRMTESVTEIYMQCKK